MIYSDEEISPEVNISLIIPIMSPIWTLIRFFYFFIWAAFNTFGLVSIADCNRSFICDVFAPKCAYCFLVFNLVLANQNPRKKVISLKASSIENQPWRALIRAFLVHRMHSAQDHQKFVFGYHSLRKLCLLGFKPGLHELTLHK